MAKKPKKSRLAETIHAKTEAAKICRDLFRAVVDEIKSENREWLVASDKGSLDLTNEEGEVVRYRMEADAPEVARARFVTAAYCQLLLDTRNTDLFLRMAVSFLVGLVNGTILVQGEMKELKAKIERLTEHRKLGGKATRRLSREQEKIARTYIAAEFLPGVSRTAACNRAASKLFKDYSITVSGRTLMSLTQADDKESA